MIHRCLALTRPTMSRSLLQLNTPEYVPLEKNINYHHHLKITAPHTPPSHSTPCSYRHYFPSFPPETCILHPLITSTPRLPPLNPHQVSSKLKEDEEKLAVSAAMRAMKRLAKKEGGLGPLTMEEGASIHIYTQENKFYKNLNCSMRDRVSYV